MSHPDESQDFLHIYPDGHEDGTAYCGSLWRYSVPLEWYLTSDSVGNYEMCQECLASEEFALAALGAV